MPSIKKLIISVVPENVLTSALRNFRKIAGRRKIIETKCRVHVIEEKSKDIFAGYYDLNPINNRLILVHSLDRKLKMNLEVRNLVNEQVILRFSTNAWNWQQGSRLRWYGENKIAYNDFEENRFCTKIYDLNGNEYDHLNIPLYDISSSGAYGISLDFTRLGYMRPGYGYTNLPFMQETISDGTIAVSFIDIKNRKTIKEITYADILKETDVINLKNCYINHLSFNKEETKFIFFFLEKVQTKHRAKLFEYDIFSDQLILLEDKLNVSHYTWIAENTLLVTAYDENAVCRYYIYEGSNRIPYAHDILTEDGHPTRLSSGDIITDTYPDRNGFQHLYRFSAQSCSKMLISDFFSSGKCTGEKRCDLHPRISENNNIIVCDVNSYGTRRIILVEGADILEN